MPTNWNGRASVIITNTISPIITGIWNDLSTWNETGKFWNDAGDGVGTIWSSPRVPYSILTWGDLGTWDSLGTWAEMTTGQAPTIYSGRQQI